MPIVFKNLPPDLEMDQLGLTRAIRFALAVGVGSSLNDLLTQVQQYSEQATIGETPFQDQLPHRLNFLVELVARDLSAAIADGIEFEEELHTFLTEKGIEYENTG